jgi:hypothetical protein
MLEAIVLNYNPIPQLEIKLEKQMALFEKSHTEEYVVYTPKS